MPNTKEFMGGAGKCGGGGEALRNGTFFDQLSSQTRERSNICTTINFKNNNNKIHDLLLMWNLLCLFYIILKFQLKWNDQNNETKSCFVFKL